MNQNESRYNFCEKLFVNFLSVLLIVESVTPFYPAMAYAQGSGATQKNEVTKFGWIRGERASANDIVSFRVFLRLSNEDKLTRFVDEVSDPRLPNYGQYKSMDEIRNLVRPSELAHQEVKQWLISAGIPESACAGDWDNYKCERVPVLAAENLLQVRINQYQHPKLGSNKVLMTEDQMSISGSVHFVTGVELYDPVIRKNNFRRKLARDISLAKNGVQARWDRETLVSPGNGPSSPLLVSVAHYPGAMNGVSVILKCGDGSITNYSSTQWCENGNDVPYSVSISPTGAFDNPQSFSLPPSGNPSVGVTCSAAGALYPDTFDKSYQDSVFCKISYTNIVELTDWVRYKPKVQTTFNDSTTSQPGNYVSLEGTTLDFINSLHIHPDWIQKQYNLTQNEGTPQITQGILELSYADCSSGCGFLPSDVQAFMDNNNINVNVSNLLSIVGPTNSMDQGETSLDVELMMSISQGVPTVLWNSEFSPSMSARNMAEALLAWAQNIYSSTNQLLPGQQTPSVWSISYGLQENIDINVTVMNQINSYFKMLAANGTSIFASSGDSGAGKNYRYNGTCYAYALKPVFPASSPYVTAVGATALWAKQQGVFPQEIVCSAADSHGITSGGGFSTVFERHSYQQSDVEAYVNIFRSGFSSLINTSNRAYPDISALGAEIYTVMNNQESIQSGTSASSPIVASIFALINQARKTLGMPLMGTVNRFLYQAAATNPSVFTDITQGNNCVGEREYVLVDAYSPKCVPGWPTDMCYSASTGWDPVTGLGSLVYPALLQAALNWSVTMAPASSTSTQAPMIPEPTSARVPGALKWSANILGASGAPVVLGDRIFVGSRVMVYALDTKNGSTVWSSNLNELPSTVSVQDDLLYVTGAALPNQFAIYALDLAYGGILWNYTLAGNPTAPEVQNDFVFVGTGQNFSSDETKARVHALNSSSGREIWSYEFGEENIVKILLRGDVLYVLRQNGLFSYPKLTALNVSSRRRMWDNELNFGCLGLFLGAGDMLYTSIGGMLNALNSKTGQSRWSVQTAGTSCLEGMENNGMLYYPYSNSSGSNQSWLASYDSVTGSQAWNVTLNATIASNGLALSSDVVYLGVENSLCAFSMADGSLLWSINIDQYFPFIGACRVMGPIVSNDVVYVAGVDGWLYSVYTGASPVPTISPATTTNAPEFTTTVASMSTTTPLPPAFTTTSTTVTASTTTVLTTSSTTLVPATTSTPVTPTSTLVPLTTLVPTTTTTATPIENSFQFTFPIGIGAIVGGAVFGGIMAGFGVFKWMKQRTARYYNDGNIAEELIQSSGHLQ